MSIESPRRAAEFKVGDVIAAGVVLLDPATGLPSQGGSGNSLADLVFMDNAGVTFVYRDDGSGTPLAFRIPEWTEYTPVTPIKSAASQIEGYALETGGNLEALNNKVHTKTNSTQLVGTDVAVITNTVIHGFTTAHGGEYVDIKANPSGALVVDTSGSAADTTLTEIDARIGRFANLRLYAVDDQGAGTTYVMKVGVTSADPWLLMKLVEASGVTLATYAGVVNNPSITTHSGAWGGRASLVYGDLTEA